MPQHQHLAVQVAAILADQAFLALRIQIAGYQQSRAAGRYAEYAAFSVVVRLIAFRRHQKLEIHAVPLPILLRTSLRALIKFRLSGIHSAIGNIPHRLQTAVMIAVMMGNHQPVQVPYARRIQARHNPRLRRRCSSGVKQKMMICRPYQHRQTLTRIPNGYFRTVSTYRLRTVKHKSGQNRRRPRTQTQTARQKDKQGGA